MTSTEPRIEGIDHIDLVVADVTAMRDFFLTVGFRLVRETEHGGGAIELRFPGPGAQPVLELTPQRDTTGTARPLGLRHMALRVPDIEAALADFAGRGLHAAKPPRRVPETGRRLANLTDPEGNALQIVEA